DEYADRVQRDQGGDAAAERGDKDGREKREDQDAGRKGQTVAPELEVVRGEAVAGQDAAEARKVREGGVGSEHQKQRGRDLYEVVVRSAVAYKRLSALSHDGLL